MRHPRIELGPPRWQRGIIATRLMAQEMVRRPGIEPGPPAWKAGILTTELSTLVDDKDCIIAPKTRPISILTH
jgi:hypothetical protein